MYAIMTWLAHLLSPIFFSHGTSRSSTLKKFPIAFFCACWLLCSQTFSSSYWFWYCKLYDGKRLLMIFYTCYLLFTFFNDADKFWLSFFSIIIRIDRFASFFCMFSRLNLNHVIIILRKKPCFPNLLRNHVTTHVI